jgi:UDP-N-acetyl-D-galactosamine dehydrogenase
MAGAAVAGAIVAAVSHRSLVEPSAEQLLTKLAPAGVYADVKCTADVATLRARGATWA